MRRAPAIAGIALLLALGALLWLVARPGERVAAPGEDGVSGTQVRAQEPLAVEPAQRRESERRALAGAPAPEDHIADQEAPLAPGEPVLRVSGLVVEGAGGAGVVNAQVFLSRGPARTLTETGSDGRFRLVLPAREWCFGEPCELVVERRGERIYLGTIALQPELLVRARIHLTLRGRLVTNVDLAKRPFFVSASLPVDAVGEARPYADSLDAMAWESLRQEAGEDTRHVGDTQLAGDGTFAIESWVELVPERFLLTFIGIGGRLFARQVPAAELLSQAGATIEQRFGELECLVVDEARAPLQDAQIRVFVSGAGGDEAGWCSSSSDAAGQALFLVLAGSLELCAGKPGFTSAVATLEHDGASRLPHEVLLRRLGPADRLRGRVIDALGRPVSGAHVSALPATRHREIGAAGASSAQTGEDGVFELVAGGELALEVTAYHADHGGSAPVRVRPGASELVLVLAESAGPGPVPAISR